MRGRARALAGAFLVLAFAGTAAGSQALDGRVVSIEDGDTVTILDAGNVQHRVRLAGIDAPERGQQGAQRSRESLAALVYEQPVRVASHKRDPYGRIVGTLWVAPPGAPCRGRPECPATLDAGLAQLQAGRAWWFRRYAAEQRVEERASYEAAERDARARRIGLWRSGTAVPPWEWRRETGRRQPAAPAERITR